MTTLSALAPTRSSASYVPPMATPWSEDQGTGGAASNDPIHFCQGSEIYGDGNAANTFFKVVSGVVRTCKFLKDGRRQIDAFHVAGDVFGMEASADYSFSAEAVCDCTLHSYRRRGLNGATFGDAGLSEQMFSYAMHSVARAQAHALLLGRRSALEKVATFLVDWAKRSLTGQDITLSMTREDIGDYLGLTIETVSRTLSQLEREGVIAFVSARRISVKNLIALQDLKS